MPSAALAVGVILALCDGGYDGLAFLLFGVVAASILAVIAAAASIVHRERLAWVALLPALPSLCYLVWLAINCVFPYR
jgi:hypothetical protein